MELWGFKPQKTHRNFQKNYIGCNISHIMKCKYVMIDIENIFINPQEV